ncbi:hypothetical protein FRC0290_01021 [Corynebacterium diphtheriae]|nr:hypothetical protein FRC0290_01021 [Corynebacterium diphtheriae]CAB1012519.1 hypothetical protein FRC0534_01050 [Corynebacterium diphtheriae]CAB1014492.1 hypothetical protein FRC0515_01210 [Corynebacterium diphtheriae]CAB1038925.1 hypothetical protein FRC0547_01269 [Corynebacterium diphtheriae]
MTRVGARLWPTHQAQARCAGRETDQVLGAWVPVELEPHADVELGVVVRGKANQIRVVSEHGPAPSTAPRPGSRSFAR